MGQSTVSHRATLDSEESFVAAKGWLDTVHKCHTHTPTLAILTYQDISFTPAPTQACDAETLEEGVGNVGTIFSRPGWQAI